MKSKTLMCITATTLLAALALPVQLAAQNTRYKLIDLGTFGGPSSSFFPGERLVTNGGLASGTADTATPDPHAPNCFADCFVAHTFLWNDDVLMDLARISHN